MSACETGDTSDSYELPYVVVDQDTQTAAEVAYNAMLGLMMGYSVEAAINEISSGSEADKRAQLELALATGMMPHDVVHFSAQEVENHFAGNPYHSGLRAQNHIIA